MKYLAQILLTASTVSAHSLFQMMWVGTEDKGSTCARVPKSNSPITSVGSADMRCNAGGSKGVTGVCSVAAGQSVSVEMHPQPGERKCGGESAIGGKHYGPVIVYMSKVADAKSADGSGEWFKVAEEALDPAIASDKAWATEKLNANCGKKSFVGMNIPTQALGENLANLERY